jgi:hypothetical protein
LIDGNILLCAAGVEMGKKLQIKFVEKITTQTNILYTEWRRLRYNCRKTAQPDKQLIVQ